MKMYSLSVCLLSGLLIVSATHAATLTVLNTDDTGPGSLRQTLTDATSGDVIEFAPGLTGATIVLATGELVIDKTLTITGLGADQLTIDGAAASRVLHITGSVTVGVTGLTIANGTAAADNGGGLLIDPASSVTLDACVLTGNTASYGGGLYNAGTVTLHNSTLASNTATAVGGGLVNFATAILSNSTVLANLGSDAGGGLWNDATLTVQGGSRIIGNSCTSYGGGIFSSNGTVLVEHSLIESNTSAFIGGGFYNDFISVATISQCVVARNQAALGAGLFNDGTLTVTRTTLNGNHATLDGGGIYNSLDTTLLVVSSTLASNTGERTGGGLINYATARIAENTFAGNIAPTGAGVANLYGELTLDNTLLANGLTGGNYTNEAGAFTVSLGHNLSDDATTTGLLDRPSDLNNTPAGLDPSGLQENGGPTPTIALAAGSAARLVGGPVYPPFTPAAGGGEPIYPPFTDQRGFPRFNCGKMDIGAFQNQDATPPVITLLGPSVVTNECPAAFTDPGATAIANCANTLNIAAGGAHSIALRIDGTVATWGADTGSLPGNLELATAVAAGTAHNLALRADGLVLAWGDNTAGQTTVPASVTNAIAIAAGNRHSLALRNDGTAIAWGDNAAGQTNIPAEVLDSVALAAGDLHSLALLADGTVIPWGDNTAGQLDVPAEVLDAVAIAAGDLHNLALLADGTVIAWGDNTAGQTIVPAEATNVVAIAAGGSHSLALLDTGVVLAWGDDTAGQLDVPAALNNAAALAAGNAHSLAITRTGAIVGWGLNSDNQTSPPADLRALDLTGSITTDTTGSTNGVGSFTRTYAISDGQGGTSSVVRTVITLDTTPPVPDLEPLPALTNSCTITLDAPTATDACAGALTATTTDPTTYNLPGAFLVTWTYADGNGNSSTQTQSVVIDTISPPAILCAPDVVATNLVDECGALVTFAAPVVTPACSSATTTQIAGLASGALFPVGITTNSFRVIDASNATNTCTFTVTVLDRQAPSITCPANILTNTAPGECVSAPLTFTPTAMDNCPGVNITSVPASGSTFPKGVTVVTSTATDAAGNTNTCTFTVTVVDQELPAITCPANIVTNTAPGACVSAPLTFAPIVNDNCPDATVVTVPASGSTFPKGVTIVTSTATDAAGNTNTCTFTVTVVDQELPSVTCPANIVTTTAPGQCQSAAVTFTPAASDNCPDVTVVSVPPSGATFAKGTNVVTCTATDAAGNTNTCTFTVTVVDQESPAITCPANIVTNATSGAGTVVLFAAPVIADNCPGVTLSNAPGSLVSGATFPVGSTVVTRIARDAAGNETVCSFTVTVGGPRLTLENAQAELVALRGATTNAAAVKQLDKAIKSLTAANALWLDESHLPAKTGKKLFSSTKSAIKTLQKMISKPDGSVPVESLQSIINQMVTAAQLVAAVIIQDATAAGVDATALAKATSEFSLGQSDETASDPANANKHYQKAWTLAAKLLAKQ